MGLKKGPWTAEEDQILINYIQLHGHGNWRALPKQAGNLYTSLSNKNCLLKAYTHHALISTKNKMKILPHMSVI
jgi:hypothetical protein